MKNELETLESLILYELEPSRLTAKGFNFKIFESWKSIAEAENKRIKKALVNEIFSLKKEGHIEMYIQRHQQELIRLKDHLLSYFPTEEPSHIGEKPNDEKTLINLYRTIYNCLRDLLTFIETYFSKYFNQEAKVPDSCRLAAMQDLRKTIASSRTRLNAKEADKKLLDMIFHPLLEFVKDSKETTISYKYLFYLKELDKELRDLSRSDFQKRKLNKQIINSLLYLNFNSHGLLTYCTQAIKEEYQQHDTLAGQLESLAFVYKNISQTQVKPSFSYKPKSKSLKNSLIEWVDEEISFLEKRRQLSLNFSVRQSQSPQQDIKLNTSLSVPQLAYLLKVFVETGIIQNKNQQEIIRFVSGGFRTKKAETVSADSLRSKFYNIEDNTRNTVKDILINMLNHVRKN